MVNKMKIYPEDTSAFPVVGLSQIGNQGIMEVYQIGMTLILTNTASLSYRLADIMLTFREMKR